MTDPIDANMQPVCIDEVTRQAVVTVDWLLEHEAVLPKHPMTTGNRIDVAVCGEEAFGRLAADLEAARGSIDIVAWGLDPGMELVRSTARDAWPRGPTFGALLDAASARGVRVRLLLWHEPGAAAMQQNNLPGYTGDQRRGLAFARPLASAERPDRGGRSLGSSPEETRNDYCIAWWRRVLETKEPHRIECLMRRGDPAPTAASLRAEADPPSALAGDYAGLASEKVLLEEHATHHQKSVLIDYAHDGGSRAVGHVLGLNSLSSYWDTCEHPYDTTLRETDWARESAAARRLRRDRTISRDPVQDYACRLVGPSLRGVHQNFVSAWKRAGGAVSADDLAAQAPPRLARVRSPFHVQIVRTQPEEGDKTVQQTYFHAPLWARHYLYIENQYFFYEARVRRLKEIRAYFVERARRVGCATADTSGVLHVFAVIPQPEEDGMVPRTYDMLKSLGAGESMPHQHKRMQDGAADLARREAIGAIPGFDGPIPLDRRDDDIVRSARSVQAPLKDLRTGELIGLAMKVGLFRLVAVNRRRRGDPDEAYARQIYIHSKLMLIDDAFFTLGSANMNQRSMAADSELNVATDDHVVARELRQRVWGMHAGGDADAIGGDASPAAIREAFRAWIAGRSW